MIGQAFFREGPDGQVVFFPWGLTRRGYRIPDAASREKASRAVSLLVGAVMAIGTWGGHAIYEALQGGDFSVATAARAVAPPLATLHIALVAYGLRVALLVEHFAPSDLRISREERLQAAATSASARKVVWVGSALAVSNGLATVLEPRAGWLGAIGVVLGPGLAWWGRSLSQIAREEPRQPLGA